MNRDGSAPEPQSLPMRRKDALPKLAAMSVEYRTESQHISARVTF